MKSEKTYMSLLKIECLTKQLIFIDNENMNLETLNKSDLQKGHETTGK